MSSLAVHMLNLTSIPKIAKELIDDQCDIYFVNRVNPPFPISANPQMQDIKRKT